MRLDENLQDVEGDRFLKTEWTLFGLQRSELRPVLTTFENMRACTHALLRKRKNEICEMVSWCHSTAFVLLAQVFSYYKQDT